MRSLASLYCACLALAGTGWVLGTLAAKESEEHVAKGSSDIFVKKLDPRAVLSPDYKASETSYFLHVPDDYDPKRPCAMLLAVSPTPEGKAMFGPWSTAAGKHSILFACPNNAGNEATTDKRGQRAVDTLADVRAKYQVDPERIYVTGFSGGARISTGLVAAFPNFFAGHLPLGGILFRNGLDGLKGLKTKFGHYLFAGENCMNRKEAEQAVEALKSAKLSAELLIGPGLPHAMPSPEQGLSMYEWFAARAAAAQAKTDAAQPKSAPQKAAEGP